MDPLSLTCSIITLATLAGQLVSVGHSYVTSVSGSSKEIRDLLAELSSLTGVLEALKDVIDPAKATSKTPIIHGGLLVKSIDDCARQLQEMLTFLTKFQTSKNKMRKMVKKLSWPLKETETRCWISKIEGYKSTFSLALSTDGMSITRAISIDIIKLKQNQENVRIQQHLEEMAEKVRRIREWLSPADPQINYKTACQLQQAGTGKWFTEGTHFKEWFSKDSSFLWIQGISGIGKTILSSIIIDKIIAETQNQDVTLVYFYCDLKDSEKQSAANLYGSLISQILEKDAKIPDELEILYEMSDKKPPTSESLKNIFVKLAQTHPKIIIVIDGLDECEDRGEVVDGLLEINSLPGSKANILVTGRKDLSTKLLSPNISDLLIKADDVRADIELYVTNEIERHVKLKRLKSTMKAEITARLVHDANGMFRWVKCCLQHIAMLRNDKAIRDALQSFPPNLEETYVNMLMKIPEEDMDLAIRVFQWLICSLRPMTIEEVAEGVSIEVGNRTLDPDNKLNDPEDILEICGGLISLNEDTRNLGFAHFSVKQYLTSQQIAESAASSFRITPQATHIELAKLCLTYVSLDDFYLGPCQTENELKDQFEKYPLLDYAAHNWQAHAKRDEKKEDHELVSMTEQFLSPLSPSGIFLSWSQAYHTEGPEPYRDYNAYHQCRSLVPAGAAVDFSIPLFSNFLRETSCGCRSITPESREC